MDREAAAVLAAPDHWFRHWMPRAFVRLGTGGGNVYLPLNGLLAPLGTTGRGPVRWRDHAARAVAFRTDPAGFDGIWYEPPGAAPNRPRRRLILYDDTPESRMDYFTRFERLMTRASWLHAPPGTCRDHLAARASGAGSRVDHTGGTGNGLQLWRGQC